MKWHLKLDVQVRKDAEQLMLYKLDTCLAKEISSLVCKRFELPQVKIRFLKEHPDVLGFYSYCLVELYGQGKNVECLVHELSHHLADNRRDKLQHGKKFIQAYTELIQIAKNFLKEKEYEQD